MHQHEQRKYKILTKIITLHTADAGGTSTIVDLSLLTDVISRNHVIFTEFQSEMRLRKYLIFRLRRLCNLVSEFNVYFVPDC